MDLVYNIINDTSLSSSEKTIMLSLINDTELTISLNEFSGRLGLSKPTLVRNINSLVQKGRIKKTTFGAGKHKKNKYRLI